MTDDGRRRLYVYDSFGRLVQVKDKSNSNALVCEYEYDALGQRVRAWHDTDADTTQDADEWECLVYDDRWRLVAVYKETSTDPILYELNVPHAAGADGFGGSSYIDSWALRERDEDLDETLETRTYYIQNWRADVISELTDALGPWVYGGSVRYSAYGEHEFLTLGDVSDGSNPVRDGGMTIDDELQFIAFANVGGLGADFDDGSGTGTPDGGYTIDDLLFYIDVYNAGGLVPDNPRFLYAGYVHDPIIGTAASALPSGTGSGLYHVRNRVYNPELGRWTRRDPLGYVDSVSLVIYVSDMPISESDPSGLSEDSCGDYSSPFSRHPRDYSPPAFPYVTSWRNCPQFAGCTAGIEKKPRTRPTSNGCGNDAVLKFALNFFFYPAFISTFTPCCNNHDFCYGSCGADKSRCDVNLFNCMISQCDQVFGGWFNRYTLNHERCIQDASLVFRGVDKYGGKPFCEAQAKNCRCKTVGPTPNNPASPKYLSPLHPVRSPGAAWSPRTHQMIMHNRSNCTGCIQ